MPHLSEQMTVAVTEIELKKLIDKFKDNPKDLDLINQIAIGYFENPSMQTADEELDFFELAYSIKKTIKSAHNLAWYLYFEWGEQERAIEIQKDLIDKNPKSFYPYYLLGFMLMEQEDYKSGMKYLIKATEKADRRDILHNLGYCYFKTGEIQKAREYFSRANTENDSEYRSAYNQAIMAFKMGNIESTKKIADRLFLNIEQNTAVMIGGYEIGYLYFLLGDYSKASDSLIKQGIDGVDLTDWKELSYSLFISNNNKWVSQHEKMIAERESWIKEINTAHEDWSFNSEQEKNEKLVELKSEIANIKELIKNEITKPDSDLSENVWIEPCGCLLFDCKRHENQPDDE